MKKVVAVFTTSIWNGVLPVIRLREPLEMAGFKVINGSDLLDQGKIDLSGIDFITFQRDFSRKLDVYEKILDLAHKKRNPVILDLDDLLFELPENHPERCNHAYSDALLPMLQALMEVDLVSVSTENLRDYVLPFNDNVVVMPNCLNDRLWILRSPLPYPVEDGKITIGYMGGASHKPDMDFLEPIFLEIIKRYPEKVQFRFWGVQPPSTLASFPQVHCFFPNIWDYRDFVTFFQSQSVDIFVGPLIENRFNTCKSPLKYFEYSSLGVSGVYSNISPYKGVITHGYNGLLASTQDEWLKCLIKLIEDNKLRNSFAANAQKEIRSKWLLSQNSSRWQGAYQRVFQTVNNRKYPQNTQLVLIKSITHQTQEVLQTRTTQLAEHNPVSVEIENGKPSEPALVMTPPGRRRDRLVFWGMRAWQVLRYEGLGAFLRSAFRKLGGKSQGYRQIEPPSGLEQVPSRDITRPSVSQPENLEKEYLALIGSSGQFDREWYLAHYPDVAEANLDPMLHYLNNGGKEGRDPGPNFQSGWYLYTNNDVKEAGMNPLVHYLKYGRVEGRVGKSDQEGKTLDYCARFFKLAQGSIQVREALKQPIDIIVPIFNGMEFLPALFDSIIKNTDTPFRLIAVDDRSTDPSVRPFLEELAHKNKNIFLVFNEENQGFVRTVNIATALVRNHFVLLNSDIEVPKGWLQRLMKPIVDGEKVASTTPFSNCGTICSFPEINVDNEMFAGLTVDAVDSVFDQIDVVSTTIELPTGVGFCMGINLDAWNNVGVLNANQFGRGYGEETDWCLRARAAGYRNLMIPNLFVYHKHGGSFLPIEKQKLSRENSLKITSLYPDYHAMVMGFLASDPPKPLRMFATLLLMTIASNEKPVLFIDQEMDGGISVVTQQIIQTRLNSGQAVFILTYDSKWQAMKLQVSFKEYETVFKLLDAKDLFILQNYIKNIQEIYISDSAGFAEHQNVVKVLPKLTKALGAKLTVLGQNKENQ